MLMPNMDTSVKAGEDKRELFMFSFRLVAEHFNDAAVDAQGHASLDFTTASVSMRS